MKLNLETLEQRVAAATLFYTLDLQVNGEAIQPGPVPGSTAPFYYVNPGDILTITVQGRPGYESGELPVAWEPGGVQAFSVALAFNNQFLTFNGGSTAEDYSSSYTDQDGNVIPQVLQVDDSTIEAVAGVGGISQVVGDNPLSAEYVDLVMLEFEVQDFGIDQGYTGLGIFGPAEARPAGNVLFNGGFGVAADIAFADPASLLFIVTPDETPEQSTPVNPVPPNR